VDRRADKDKDKDADEETVAGGVRLAADAGSRCYGFHWRRLRRLGRRWSYWRQRQPGTSNDACFDHLGDMVRLKLIQSYAGHESSYKIKMWVHWKCRGENRKGDCRGRMSGTKSEGNDIDTNIAKRSMFSSIYKRNAQYAWSTLGGNNIVGIRTIKCGYLHSTKVVSKQFLFFVDNAKIFKRARTTENSVMPLVSLSFHNHKHYWQTVEKLLRRHWKSSSTLPSFARTVRCVYDLHKLAYCKNPQICIFPRFVKTTVSFIYSETIKTNILLF